MCQTRGAHRSDTTTATPINSCFRSRIIQLPSVCWGNPRCEGWVIAEFGLRGIGLWGAPVHGEEILRVGLEQGLDSRNFGGSQLPTVISR